MATSNTAASTVGYIWKPLCSPCITTWEFDDSSVNTVALLSWPRQQNIITYCKNTYNMYYYNILNYILDSISIYIYGDDTQFWELPNLTTHKNVTGTYIENQENFFRSILWKMAQSDPTNFKICVYAISFLRRLGYFSKKVLISWKYLVSHFRLTFVIFFYSWAFRKCIFSWGFH